ncbi:beta-N-acetylhexosaminidase [Foetidibacter luteolus]|uniref:beta-N-acetylhexosaminidase n=1 Tax=Foetidibacter luteolus TaxID=2608880 RepID=UPI00129B1174|nr:family 20 glycosylhydrolase [Foetidibacter luteolus]
MKKCMVLLCLCFALNSLYAQQNSAVAIIPQPVKITESGGVFKLPETITIQAPEDAELKHTLSFLQERFSTTTGKAVNVAANAELAAIKLQLLSTPDGIIGNEGYHLSVTPAGAVITANKAAGIFYGVQTLLQLLPKEIEGKEKAGDINWQAPCVEVTDYPRFGWRGLMFDVSRHFFTKDEVKSYIDKMARYKFNLLHWHLTDDEGWRIEIKSLPKLTEVGAWNVKKTGYFGTFSAPTPDEPRTYGGFYTQDDIKEVIAYAKERFVNILPEVDVPGHSLAAVASYPELSCTPGADKYKVGSGNPFIDWTDHGMVAHLDNTLCPANEKVYGFLDKVFTEVAALFPFDYIHVGGDECAKTFWHKSAAIKALMKKENLKTMEEVQSYFEKRVLKIVEAKGKKLIGWDEILEGGLAPGAAVMSWRGEKGGIEAAKMQHEVVMSPTTFVYIDYMQGDAAIEPRVYASLRLNKAYQFEPVPEGVDAKYIKGGQANLWTEQVYNMRHAEYMTWPRAFATAESVWSAKEAKNWNNFTRRVEQHFKRFDAAETNYAPSMYDPIFTSSFDGKGQLQITLATEIEGLDIYYSFDNSFPDRFYPKYTETVTAPKDAVMMKVITYRGKEPIGRLIYMPLDEMKKRAKAKK